MFDYYYYSMRSRRRQPPTARAIYHQDADLLTTLPPARAIYHHNAPLHTTLLPIIRAAITMFISLDRYYTPWQRGG
jgi:hypothetical protein